MKVLVVDDDPAVSQLVVKRLTREGFETVHVADGLDAVPAVQAHRPDLVLLDLTLPGRDGRDICRELKETPALAPIPVIIMSGLDEDEDRIAGLELGADDYVTKPFNDQELALRVRAVLRRAHGDIASPIRYFGSLVIDVPRRRVTVGGEAVALTTKEFDLLHALAEARGRVLSRAYLLQEVWGYTHGEELHTRTIDVHVRHLRRKLGPEGVRVETAKGVGYRLNSDTGPAS